MFSSKSLSFGDLKYTFQYNRHVVQLSLVEVNISGSPFDIDVFKTVIDHLFASFGFELTFDVDNPTSIITIVLQNRVQVKELMK